MQLRQLLSLVAITIVAGPSPAFADDQLVTPLGRLRWTLGDDTTLGIGLRMQNDTVRFEQSATSLADENDFRRARVGVQIRHKDWGLGVDYDTGISEGYKNVQLNYRGWRRQRIVFGNQVVPFSMEDLTSSSNLPFAERSVAAALAPGTLLGVSYRKWWDDAAIHVGVFGDELSGKDRRRLRGRSAIGRMSARVMSSGKLTLHAAVGAEFRDVDQSPSVRIRTRPATRLATRRLVDTRSVDGVDQSSALHFEAAATWRSLRVISEATRLRLETADGPRDLTGQYVMASVAFGARPYTYRVSRGIFDRIRPTHRLGALELSARFGVLDLNDMTIGGGRQTEFALGATWTLNRNVNVVLNHVRVNAQPDRDGVNQRLDLHALRVELRI